MANFEIIGAGQTEDTARRAPKKGRRQMIDTNSINWGVNKLATAFEVIQPKIEGLTKRFIEYKVIEQIINNCLCFLILIFILLLWIPVYKYGNGKDKDGINFDEVLFIFPTAIIGIFAIALALVSFGLIPDTILAIKFPEMFAIQSLVCKK